MKKTNKIDHSVLELERMLADRQQQLQLLVSERNRLETELAKVKDKIGAIQGRHRVKTAGKKGEQPRLRDLVVGLLSRTKKGFTLRELHEMVMKAGYKSTSRNFRNVLYQCLYNSSEVFYDEKTETYKMGPGPESKSPAQNTRPSLT